MHIPEGTRIGILREGGGNTAARLWMGKTATVGPLRGFAVGGAGEGVKILFLIPVHLPGWVVTKSGKRQAGAFLLGPDERFTVKDPTQKETVYCFSAVSAVEVVSDKEMRCGFCRTPVKEGDAGWLPLAPKTPAGDRMLCHSCARAWEVIP